MIFVFQMLTKYSLYSPSCGIAQSTHYCTLFVDSFCQHASGQVFHILSKLYYFVILTVYILVLMLTKNSLHLVFTFFVHIHCTQHSLYQYTHACQCSIMIYLNYMSLVFKLPKTSPCHYQDAWCLHIYWQLFCILVLLLDEHVSPSSIVLDRNMVATFVCMETFSELMLEFVTVFKILTRKC